MDRKRISAYSRIFYTLPLWLNSPGSYRFLTGKYTHRHTYITNNITGNVNINPFSVYAMSPTYHIYI